MQKRGEGVQKACKNAYVINGKPLLYSCRYLVVKYLYGHTLGSGGRGILHTYGSGGTCMDTHMVVGYRYGHTHGSREQVRTHTW